MTWLLLATGFTGALTLVYLARLARRAFRAPPSAAAHLGPEAGCADLVVGELRRARREVLLLAPALAARPVAQALVDAKLRGVQVEVVLAPGDERNPESDLHFLLEQGLAPLIAGVHAPRDKVFLVDGSTLLAGSFDLGQEAEPDAGSLLVVKGHPDVAGAYRRHFTRYKQDARPAQPRALLRSEVAPAADVLRPAA
jgi:phosphatidylserine/phosphatidylglycerophosphate/cardiolipin synthase-like enzyme